MIRAIFHILFFISSFVLHAQTDTPLATDNRAIEQRHFEPGINDRYSGNRYNYDTERLQGQNILQRGLSWLFNKLEKWFGVEISDSTFEILTYLIYGILILIGIAIVARILKLQDHNSLFSKTTTASQGFESELEEMESTDLEKEIENALAQNNYRLAIRYMYLKSLKMLSLQNLIDWDFDKTNSDYYSELQDAALKSGFQKVSYWYDYIWYGEFSLDKQRFLDAKADFDELNQHILHVR